LKKCPNPLVAAQHWQRVASATRGLAAAWSRLLAIRLHLVPIGVGVGIGIGIGFDFVLGLVLTHGAISLPEFPVSKSHLFSFDSDSDPDTDPDPGPDYNPYRDRDAFVLY
jgi:hypothetical protein